MQGFSTTSSPFPSVTIVEIRTPISGIRKHGFQDNLKLSSTRPIFWKFQNIKHSCTRITQIHYIHCLLNSNFFFFSKLQKNHIVAFSVVHFNRPSPRYQRERSLNYLIIKFSAHLLAFFLFLFCLFLSLKFSKKFLFIYLIFMYYCSHY